MRAPMGRPRIGQTIRFDELTEADIDAWHRPPPHRALRYARDSLIAAAKSSALAPELRRTVRRFRAFNR
jgi:hypothetical protein